MKKLISFVAVAVATLAMTTSVFAASVTGISSLTPNVTVAEVASTVRTAAEPILNNTTELKSVLTAGLTSDPTLASTVQDGTVSVLGLVDIEGVQGQDFTISVAGVNAGDTVLLIHWINSNMTNPEIVRATVNANGTITARFNSFSPVAIVKVTASTASTPTSPKTADNGVAGAMAVALIAVAGIAVITKKKSVVR